MPIDRSISNVGIEYQYRVNTYAAACLSEDEDVEDYEIRTNLEGLPGFDDLVARVKYKSKRHYCVYMCQIKYSDNDYNFNYGKKYYLLDYKNFMDTILKTKDNYSYLHDVPDENLVFLFFTNSRLCYTHEEPLLLSKSLPIEYDISDVNNYKTIFPCSSSATCHKLIPRNKNEDGYVFDNFFLLQCQPNNDQIKTCITDLNTAFSTDIANKIICFGSAYFDIPCSANKPIWLTKDVFETEILRLCLSTYTISPKHATEINAELAPLWNTITLKHDITLIDSDIIDVVPLIFGCFWMKIKDLYDNSFDWNSCISDGKKLNNSFDKRRCTGDLRQNNIRHYICAPDTVDSLLIEMWKCDLLPLVLSVDCNLSLLHKYRHLQKTFIILDAEQKIADKIRPLRFKVFSSAANVCHKYLESDELFNKIFISLQGRKPINLSVLIQSNDVMYHLKCFHILRLMEQKKIFLRRECLEVNNSIVFLIVNEEFQESINIDDLQIQHGTNVTIYCKPSDVEKYMMQLGRKFRDYSICHLRDTKGKLLYIEGDVDKIMNFLIDSNDEEIYIDEGKPVTIIGRTLNDTSTKYIKRYLKKATLEDSFFILQGRQVYIFTGEIDTLNPSLKKQTVKGCIEEMIIYIKSRLKENKPSFVIATKDDSDECWQRLSSEALPLFQIYVRNGNMELLRYKVFQNLNAFISYEGEEFEEKHFFNKTTNGTTVVSGEPGIGKSTLLRSLFKAGDSATYSLFCDLVDYRNDLKEIDAEILKQPLSHILNKFEKLTSTNTKPSIYANFLRSLCVAYQNKGKLVLYIDSFDEILPIYKQEVLKFVRSVAKTNIRIVIASRLIADGLLINNFEVQLIHIDRLHTDSIRMYLHDQGVSMQDLEKIPSELLGNPLYLSLLDTLRREGTIIFNNINSFRLCKQVIEKNIKLYYLKQNEHYDPESTESWCQRENVLEVHKLLAMATMFGKKTVAEDESQYKRLIEECTIGPIRLGIIIRFSDGYPVFLHHIYAEFLAAEYLSEHDNRDFVRQIYQKMLDGPNIHVRRLFDSFLCDGLELHQAVIEENLEQVEHFCVKKCELLDTEDKYGRSALHVAASYCYAEETFNTKNCKILETLARYMEQRQCDLEVRDSLKGYKWFEYIKDNENLCDEARRLGLTRILNSVTFKYVITVNRMEEQRPRFIDW